MSMEDSPGRARSPSRLEHDRLSLFARKSGARRVQYVAILLLRMPGANLHPSLLIADLEEKALV